jgi:hypothetical protein
MALFIAQLFYPSVHTQKASLQAMHEEIRRASGNKHRALAYGEHTCAIGFESDIPIDQLHSRFSGLGSELFAFLLIEISDAVQGSLDQDTWKWLLPRLPKRAKTNIQ